MKKSNRIEAWVESSGMGAGGRYPRFYYAYFECFNKGLYYEAHDVLEQLWLPEKRNVGENSDFFKGLIQLAGAFVHLSKQHSRPWHPKDGRRLRPAARLFALAAANLARYGNGGRHLGVDVVRVNHLCRAFITELEGADFSRNPWHPEALPQLQLEE